MIEIRVFFSTLANLYPGTPLATYIVLSVKCPFPKNLILICKNFIQSFTNVKTCLFLVGNFDVWSEYRTILRAKM